MFLAEMHLGSRSYGEILKIGSQVFKGFKVIILKIFMKSNPIFTPQEDNQLILLCPADVWFQSLFDCKHIHQLLFCYISDKVAA